MSGILKALAGLLAIATEFFKWRNKANDRNKHSANTDALVEDLDAMDDALRTNDLREMGRLIDEVDDVRPRTRGIENE